jgi:hypothetical protein
MEFEMIAVDDEDLVFSVDVPGMAWLHEVMHRADALSDEQVDDPALPDGWDEITLERVSAFVGGARDLHLELSEAGFQVGELQRVLDALRAAIPDAPDDDLIAALAGYEDRVAAVVSRPGSKAGKVPAYKFESQDGWLVGPEESRGLAAALKRALDKRGDELFPDQEPRNPITEQLERDDDEPMQLPSAEEAREWVGAWIAFNEEAAGKGGYRVA